MVYVLIFALLASAVVNVFFLLKVRSMVELHAGQKDLISGLEAELEGVNNKFSFLRACGMKLPDPEKVKEELGYLGRKVVSARKAKEDGLGYHDGTWTFEALDHAEKNLQLALGIALRMKYPISPELSDYLCEATT